MTRIFPTKVIHILSLAPDTADTQSEGLWQGPSTQRASEADERELSQFSMVMHLLGGFTNDALFVDTNEDEEDFMELDEVDEGEEHIW